MAVPFLTFNALFLVAVYFVPWPLWLRVLIALPFLVLLCVGVMMFVIDRRNGAVTGNTEPSTGPAPAPKR